MAVESGNNSDYVFVYATLKSDQPLCHIMKDPSNGNALLIGEGKTKEKYPFILATDWNIPFLLQHPGRGKQIFGEVYKVDEKMMLTLDKLERYPELYDKNLVTVEVLENITSTVSSKSGTFVGSTNVDTALSKTSHLSTATTVDSSKRGTPKDVDEYISCMSIENTQQDQSQRGTTITNADQPKTGTYEGHSKIGTSMRNTDVHQSRSGVLNTTTASSVGNIKASTLQCWVYLLKSFPESVLEKKEFVERYDAERHNLNVTEITEFHDACDNYLSASYIYDVLMKDAKVS